MSLTDKDDRCEILLPVRHRKAEIGMEWAGRPEGEVTASAKMGYTSGPGFARRDGSCSGRKWETAESRQRVRNVQGPRERL